MHSCERDQQSITYEAHSRCTWESCHRWGKFCDCSSDHWSCHMKLWKQEKNKKQHHWWGSWSSDCIPWEEHLITLKIATFHACPFYTEVCHISCMPVLCWSWPLLNMPILHSRLPRQPILQRRFSRRPLLHRRLPHIKYSHLPRRLPHFKCAHFTQEIAKHV